ncbi:MAG: hypothetical protein H0V97_11415, partial [Actinobacteria bacterium]|nr:hypothetical protein [Actinomycetota bacterium]
TSLKVICYEHMQRAWNKASDHSRLPTHWRQTFYVMRPICDDHPDSDRPLTDTTFKNILESYLEEYQPGWDVLRGARGVFKEPHSAENDSGLAMSTMNVRNYLRGRRPDPKIKKIPKRFPTKGAHNRIAAVLICEKEGFDELLQAEGVPERFDLALMSTKGISALAARDLAESLNVPCFTLHDLDKNGFVMAAGFPFATDIGLRLADVQEWDLAPEGQYHRNPRKTYSNLIRNGATADEAHFISEGQRVELNMLTGRQFVEYVEGKLNEHGVEKVVPDASTLEQAWKRAHLRQKVNALISRIYKDESAVPRTPDDLSDQVRRRLEEEPESSWDEAIADIAGKPGTEEPG